MTSIKHNAASRESLLNNSALFVFLMLLLSFLFLTLHFSSRFIRYLLETWTSTKWQRCVAITLICFCWLWLFGFPATNQSYFASNVFKDIIFQIKIWSDNYRLPYGTKVQVLWVQIYFWLIPAWSILKLRFRNKPKIKIEPIKRHNSNGYIITAEDGEFEHRNIAKQILGRELEANEVVHHVNGIRTNNEIGNLCLMDSEKHEHFHSWLRWKKEKNGRYPSIAQQKRVLEEEYGGTLLETITSRRYAK